MPKAVRPEQEVYTEQEAAEWLGISLSRLRSLLDEHIFNDGKSRPLEVMFQASDLVLLEFWDNCRPNPKVIRMPRQRP